MGWRVLPVVARNLVFQFPPLVVASRHLRELRQSLHNGIHLCLDRFWQIGIDMFAADLRQCLGEFLQLFHKPGVIGGTGFQRPNALQ